MSNVYFLHDGNVNRVSPEFSNFDNNFRRWFNLTLSIFSQLERNTYQCSDLVFSYLYQIAHLGDDDEEPEFSSAMPLEEGDTFFFAPRQLKNLVLVDEMESLSPVMACHIADLGRSKSLMEWFNGLDSS